MKKRFWLILLAVVCIVSALAVTAFATGETPSLAIVNKSMSFNSSLFMNFKVKQQGVADEEMSLLIWTAPQEQYIKGTETMALPVERTEADGRKVFVYRDIDSRKMTDTIYARAYANVKGQEVYSEPVKFSIVEYANTLHQISDYAAMYPLLDTMLQYGAESQKHFKYHLDFLASDPVCQIQVVGAKLPDGFTKGTYKKGTALTITADAPAEGMEFSHFENSLHATVSTENPLTYTVTKDDTLTAVYKKIGVEPVPTCKLAYVPNPDNTTCTVTGIGTYDKPAVYIPEKIDGYTVTAIGKKAFENQTNMISVGVSKSISTIGENAFSGCTNLGCVYYGGKESDWNQISVQAGNDLLSGTTRYYYSENKPTVENKYWHYVDNIPTVWKDLFSKGLSYRANADGKTCEITGVGSCQDTALMIPPTINEYKVTSIAPDSFRSKHNILSVVIPEGVTKIGSSAFKNCYDLVTATLPSTLSALDVSAFHNCQKLSTVNTPSRVPYGSYVGSRAFRSCYKLQSISIPEGVTHIGSQSFYTSYALQSVSIPSTVRTIEPEVFFRCSNLQYTIYDNAKYIGNVANPHFACMAPTNIDIASCNLHHNTKVIAQFAFSNTKSLSSVVIPEGVKTLGGRAFLNSGITDVILPSSLDQVEQYAFSGCANLASVVIPNSIKDIRSYAFLNCSALENIYYVGTESTWNSISMSPNDAMSLDVNKYYYSESQPVTAGDYWHYVSKAPTKWEKMKSSGLDYQVNPDGVTCTIVGIGTCKETQILIPDMIEGYTVTAIGNDAFNGVTNLKSITLSSNITKIGDNVFNGCTNMVSVTIPDSVTHIGIGAFLNCNRLNFVHLHSLNQWINTHIGANGNPLHNKCRLYAVDELVTELVFPNDIDTIDDHFKGCKAITKITIPNNIRTIGVGAFENCFDVRTVVIPSSVTMIQVRAFLNCYNMERVYIDSLDQWFHTIIGTAGNPLRNGCDLYAGNQLVTTVSFPSGMTGIDQHFEGCTSITHLTVPDSVTDISADAFNGCKNITYAILSGNIQAIGTGAFNRCQNLTMVYYGNTQDAWNQIQIGENNGSLLRAPRYYYSEEQPTTAGHFWHYVGLNPVVWPTVEPSSWDGYTQLPGHEMTDFHGKEFVIAGQSGTDPRWESGKEIYSDDPSPIQTAVRDRNRIMETLYNCKITGNITTNPAGLVAADVASGKHTIDIYTTEYTTRSIAEEGNCYNLYTLGIDFTNSWWDQNYVNTYTIQNANGVDTMYSMVGDFSLSSFAATQGLIINKNLYNTAVAEGLGYDIYELVRTGKWTMDVFVEMMKAAAVDNNGNHNFRYEENDTVGWIRTSFAKHSLHSASGMSIISNNNGVLKFNVTENIAAWETMMNKAITTYKLPEGETIHYSMIPQILAENKALFASEALDVLERMKQYPSGTFGVVPHPKYSETQKNYASYVDNHFYGYSVPITVTEITELGEFIELYAAHSQKIVRKAWIDTFAYQYCDGANSADMLNIILDTHTYDPGYLMFYTCESDISSIISSAQNTVVDWVNEKEQAVAEDIKNYVANISDNKA